jgi:hypothetical protein
VPLVRIGDELELYAAMAGAEIALALTMPVRL